MNDYDDILIAIHGIGAQSRNATVRSVATRLSHSAALYWDKDAPPLSPQPLGWFYSDVKGAVKVAPLDTFRGRTDMLARTGFTEIFWADIPQEVVEEGRTMEETKAWARTVVARARAIFKIKQRSDMSDAEKEALIEPDFSLAAEVLEEIIDTVYVLENLMFLAEKAGLLKFDLDEVLEEYLGDVQIVTEFSAFRSDIVGRFHAALEQIHVEYPHAKLHIVAHSEGTVVSFLGLLHALSGRTVTPASASGGAKITDNGTPPPWLEQVNGYMTIGSPIDKHLLMWPRLFEDFNFSPAQSLFQTKAPIKWRNYYDYGDPVGFQLETARRWLKDCLKAGQRAPFEFEEAHDFGFARYLMPGKAHNDYWDDGEVFEHFIVDVVKGEPAKAKPPETRRHIYVLSPAIPYLISFGILVTGTFILLRATSDYLHPNLDPLQRYIRFMVLGLSEQRGGGLWSVINHVFVTACLIAGTTLLARLPRLAAGAAWFRAGLAAYALGALIFFLGFVIEPILTYLLDPKLAPHRFFPPLDPRSGPLPWGMLFSMLFLALLTGLFGFYLVVKTPSHEFGSGATQPRKQRWFRKGMRPLILCGGLAVVILIAWQLRPHSDLEKPQREALLLTGTTSAEKAHLESAIQNIDRAHLTRQELDMLLYPQGTLTGTNGQSFTSPKQIESISQVLTPHPSVWPMLLSGAAFLYLWWLAALIFDLAFVWQRYIRHSLTNDRLMKWRNYKPLTAAEPMPSPEDRRKVTPVSA